MGLAQLVPPAMLERLETPVLRDPLEVMVLRVLQVPPVHLVALEQPDQPVPPELRVQLPARPVQRVIVAHQVPQAPPVRLVQFLAQRVLKEVRVPQVRQEPHRR